MFKLFSHTKANLFNNKRLNERNINRIPASIVEEYNKCRPYRPMPVLCYAPFKSMYFDIDGRVGACGLSFKEYEKYPENSIKGIWNGEKFRKHRQMILNNDLSFEFNVCKTHLLNRNFHSSKSIWYDNLPADDNYPVLLEFELENTCNLECIMCNAQKSSSIRRKKHLESDHKSPYDGSFVKQLEEFIPHLKKAIFIGGEPFLINIYYEIWEKMAALNPGMIINVNTNCTVLNDRIKDVIRKSNFEFNLSIDSLDKTTYEQIRVNASFESTMNNLYYFHQYCEEKNTKLYLSPCPMKNNWKEIPDFVRFCNNMNITLFLYTLFQPYDLALWSYSSSKLKEIYIYLIENEFTVRNDIERHNNIQYQSFINQISTWYNDALAREQNLRSEDSVLNKSGNKVRFMQKIKNHFSENTNLSDEEINQKASFYGSVIDNMMNNLPADIIPERLYKKLNSFDASFILQQMDINDEKELIDQAKMLYYTSYLV